MHAGVVNDVVVADVYGVSGHVGDKGGCGEGEDCGDGRRSEWDESGEHDNDVEGG